MPCFPFFRRSDEIQRDVLIFGLTDAYAYFDDLRCVSFCTTLYRLSDSDVKNQSSPRQQTTIDDVEHGSFGSVRKDLR